MFVWRERKKPLGFKHFLPYGQSMLKTKPLPKKYIIFDIFIGYVRLQLSRCIVAILAAYRVYVSPIGVGAYSKAHIAAYAPLQRNYQYFVCCACLSLFKWSVIISTPLNSSTDYPYCFVTLAGRDSRRSLVVTRHNESKTS